MATKKKPQKATQAQEKAADQKKTLAEEKAREADRKRKAKSRLNLDETLGKNIPLRLKPELEKRFLKLCKLHGRIIKGKKTLPYSQMFSDLINYCYIDTMLKYETEESKEFYDTYSYIWDCAINEKLDDEVIAKNLNNGQYRKPAHYKSGRSALTSYEWTAEDVEKYRSLDKIIATIKKLGKNVTNISSLEKP